MIYYRKVPTTTVPLYDYNNQWLCCSSLELSVKKRIYWQRPTSRCTKTLQKSERIARIWREKAQNAQSLDRYSREQIS